MKTHETKSLILRKFEIGDFESVHQYASIAENVKYMPWGPNDEEQTRAFISRSIAGAEKTPITDFQYAVVLKETGHLIGGCGINISGYQEAEVGWILHRDFWKRGYGSEMGAALLEIGFGKLNVHRIVAHCAAENYGSYRVMERNGMRREGCFIQSRPPKNLSCDEWSDEYTYAILVDEWRTLK